MKNETKIPLFRRFVIQNFPYIEQDFDALTDYQLISKVVEYLNKVIESQNDLVDDMNDLETAFNTLKDYVDHYFDNLDVQEEINNKLDAMAEAGTLQEIITTYIQSNVAWTFDTVADMKLSTNLVAGSYARTLGFRSLNDGGGALYKITDTGTANEMDVIAIGSTLYANLIYGKELNVKQIGAYGDNDHDDSTVINRAIYLSDNVKIPTGDYKITNSININKTMNFNCLGTIYNGATDGIVLTASYSNIYVYYIAGNHTNNAFVITSGANNTVHNKITIDRINQTNNGICFVGDNGKGISYNEIHFKNLYCVNACILFQGDELSNAYISENNFYGGRLGNGYGIKTIYAESQSIPFESMRFYHVGFEGITCAAQMSHCLRWVFRDCRTSELGMLTGDYWFIVDEYSGDNYFDCTYLEIPKINDNNNQDRRYNTYTAHQLTINGTQVAKTMRVYKGKRIFEDRFNYYKYQGSNEIPTGYNELDYAVSAPYYFNGMYIIAGGDNDGSYSITLGDAFGLYGVTDFYLYVTNKTAGSTLRIKGTASGSPIIKYTAFDGAITNKLYHIEKLDRISNSNSNEWSITSVY